MRIGAAVATRPTLWPTALRQIRRLAEPGWWRRPPFLPVPSRDYLRFRAITQYGTPDGTHVPRPVPADVLNYLTWCRRAER